MAIQFHCPFCTAPIRVPDSSGGKRGRCPKCKSKLRVPKPDAAPAAAPPESPAPVEPIVAPPPQPFAEQPAAPDSPPFLQNPEATSEVAPVAPPTAGRPVSYAKALQRRRKSRQSLFWVPMLFGSILVAGIAGWFFWQGQTRLEGTLNGAELIEPALEPKTLAPSYVALEDEKIKTAMKYLIEHPIRGLDSGRLMEHDVEVSESTMTIQVLEPVGMRFFRVDIGDHADLMNYYREHQKSLDKARLKELESGATAFFEECLSVANEGGALSTPGLERFRRQVAVNLLIGGLGYHVVATVDRTAYLCVYEDKKSLYFLLPIGTKRFQLKGRSIKGNPPLFPGKFTVAVKEVEKPATEESGSKTSKSADEKSAEPPAKTGKTKKTTKTAKTSSEDDE